MDDKSVYDEAVIDDKVGYASLSQYMAEPTVSLHQYQDKVLFKFNFIATDKDTILDFTLEIPTEFKDSLFCQAIIAYCYCDTFRALEDSTIKGYIDLFKRFFLFLLTHDENCHKEKSWSELVALPSGDLPYTVMHEFLLYLSHDGTGASTLWAYQYSLQKPIKWASELNVKTGGYHLLGGDKLLPYLKENINPQIKKDDKNPKPALSELFSMNYETGEKIQCPYTDSQLITNLRWFAHWYLNIMRERRLFLRKIKWDEHRTIYEILFERLSNATWSLDSNPVKKMFNRHSKIDKTVSLSLFMEASGMYAKIYEALLPSKPEVEEIEKGIISDELANRLLWLEPLGLNQDDTQALFNEITNYQGNTSEIITRIEECFSHHSSYSSKGGKSKKIIVPISLKSSETGLREITIPNFSLADMIVPTASERVVMSWLLASDCLQRSNQFRLNLSDFKQSKRGKTLKILTSDTIDDVDVTEAKIRHHKRRSKGGDVKKIGKNYETITYKRGDPLLTTYTNWLDDMTEAQVHLTKGKGKWFHTHPPRSIIRNVIFPLSFLCAKTSMFRTTFEKAEQVLKYHSELNGQGAFRWLLSAQLKHLAYTNNNKGDVSEITLGADAVRQSRIIFNEGQDMTDAENAKETAHSEQQVVKYREAGVAKERIQNGLKGNIQVANKMIDEAISILNSCHLMSVDEVQKSLHDPSGFTVNDVVKFINEIAATPEKYDVTIFGGIINKADPDSGIKIINDENSAMMMWSYIKHMEFELQSIKDNHDEQQVVKHLFEHAQWSILFDRFPFDTQQQAKLLAKKFTIPYPPLF